MAQPTRRPTSTYRLQITAELDLHAAARTLPHLHDLGVDWVYLSPILVAEPGSQHGYDVIAHDTVDPARGGREGLAALSAAARELGMGVLVDIVPNHVGIATPKVNAWWWDVLKHGRGSAYADYFDIDWDFGGGKVRIPVLGADEDVEDLEVVDGRDGPVLRYYEHSFPVSPDTPAGSGGAVATPAELHAHQHYELVHWRRADDELNYRRFFAVNTLAAVRVEEPEVFDATHVEIRRWFDEGLVDGLRVDHPDGLRDPGGYLEDLAGLTGGAYVLVEKILEHGEDLPREWRTDGTTGYDALALVDRVLVDPAGERTLTDLETRLRGEPLDWAAMVHDRKREVADGILRSEVRRIVRDLRTDDPGLPVRDEVAEDAVAELLACFGVYRSYLPGGRDHLDAAVAEARSRRHDLDAAYESLAPLLARPDGLGALRFQQTSGMVMAKGVEDCSFYRTSRLTSLNEVGGDPGVFSVSPREFHEAMAQRQEHWPYAMTTLSTHDTKRGEDVRARISVIAELPELWAAQLTDVLRRIQPPEWGFGSLLVQALVGAWPVTRERAHAYAEKAMREAGERTTWTDPDTGYEDAVHAAVDRVFDDTELIPVWEALVDLVEEPGWSNALSAKLVALTMPGVPDVYQGSELSEQSLVDPDNRRPVTFGREPAGPWEAAKLLVTRTALRLRRDRPELFTGYAPVTATGPSADHALAFDRGGAVTVATRLPVGLRDRGGWGDTVLDLPAGRWRDLLTDRVVDAPAPLGELLDAHPVALLVEEDR